MNRPGVLHVGKGLELRDSLYKRLVVFDGGNPYDVRRHALKDGNELLQVVNLVGQEGEGHVPPVKLHLWGDELFQLCQGFSQHVLPDVALHHVVHIVNHLGDFPQGGLVIVAVDGVVGQLLRSHLGTAEAGDVQDDKDLLHHPAVLRRTDAVMPRDDLDLFIDEGTEREAFELPPLFDVVSELLLGLVLHNPGVDVLFPDVGQLNLGDDQAVAHVRYYFVADFVSCRLFCHLSSLHSHSFRVSFSVLSISSDS